jgi:phosphoribosylformylglycinamidine (FGAM) synthase-like amidotransferase family enzyme
VKRGEIRVCVLRVAGTNCDAETKRSFEALGVRAEVVHVNEVVKRRGLLSMICCFFVGFFLQGLCSGGGYLGEVDFGEGGQGVEGFCG